MDIGVNQRCLGAVEADALAKRILEQEPSAWNEQLLRQQMYEVHKDTESIVLLFCDEEWPEGACEPALACLPKAEASLGLGGGAFDPWTRVSAAG